MKNRSLKRAISLFLSLLMIFSTVSVLTVTSFAETSGDWEYQVNDSKAEITYYRGSDSVVTVPSTLDGYTVTGIREYALRRNTVSITIPAGITEISPFAFSASVSLESITVASGNTAYASSNGVLFNKDKTEIIRFPIAKTASNYSIPSGVLTIGGYAFRDCEAISQVTIPDSVTSIGEYAFYGSSLSSVEIGNGVQTIGDNAFGNCDLLTEISIPDSVTSVGNCAFYHCDALESATLGSGLSALPHSMFDSCKALKSIEIPSGVTSIGEGAFSMCDALESVTIPDGLTDIGDCAFQNCIALHEITIPASVTSIDGWAFHNCTGLTIYGYDDTAAQTYAKENSFKFVSLTVHEFEYALENGKAIIVEYNGTRSNVVVPSMLDEYYVVGISDTAFRNCTTMTSITIHEGIETIGENAFIGCTSLKTITVDSYNSNYSSYNGVLFNKSQNELICYPEARSSTNYSVPATVTDIGSFAFYNCSLLSNVTIPTNVQSIGNYAFYGCNLLSNVRIPKGVTVIGDYTFSACTSLESITFSGSITTFGNYSFSDCSALANITIPESVEQIGEYAFSGCSSITELTFSENIVSIGEHAFDNCASLTIYGYERTEAERYATENSIPFVSLTVHEYEYTVDGDNATITKYIGDQSSVIVPSTVDGYNVVGLQGRVFSGRDDITSVSLPDSIESIDCCSFNNCSSLTSISVDSGNMYFSSKNGVLFDKNQIMLVRCPEARASNGYSVPSTVESIYDYAFSGCGLVLKVIIPNSVETIGNNAFLNCTSLNNVTIGSNVNTISSYAFSGCTSLLTVSIPSSVETIGMGAFSGCFSLKSVTINNGVKNIGDEAFRLCNSLTSVTIPASVEILGNKAFYDCESLVNLTIKSGVSEIRTRAFSGCINLLSVEIPDSVESIGDYAFYGCFSLENVTIKNGVKIIGQRAFSECTKLKSIIIPDSVTKVGNYAFSKCTSLESASLSNGLTSLNVYVFNGCTSLTSVIIPQSITVIGLFAFGGCDLLTIYGYDASYAETYANNNNIPFVSLSVYDFEYIIVSSSTTPYVTVTKYIGSDSNVVIPSTIKGYSVTTVAEETFADCNYVNDITIPDSIKTIGDAAFNGCSSLANIYVNSGNSNYAAVSGVLFNKAKTTLICYPEGKTSSSYTVPSTVKTIESKAFCNNASLKSVTIPTSVTAINSNAFYNCTALTSVTIPTSVTAINSNTFCNCTALTSVTIPKNVTTINANAFYNCGSLTIYGYYDTAAETYANNNGIPFVSLNTPEDFYKFYVQSGKARIYGYTGKETKVTVPEKLNGYTVEVIEDETFLNCDKITDITIPACIKEIGYNVFDGCTSLKSITVSADNANYTAASGVLFNKDKTELLRYPEGRVSNNYSIPSTVTSIAEGAFWDCKQLSGVTIPNGVTTIGWSAFSGCSLIKKFTIPASVTYIDNYAFSACSGLESFVVASANTAYSSDNGILFDKNKTLLILCPQSTQLTSYAIPDSVEDIFIGAFANCTSLESVTFPEGLVNINDDAFYGCTSLLSVKIPEGVDYIGELSLGYRYDSATDMSVLIDGFKIYGTKDSHAEEYADFNSIPFVAFYPVNINDFYSGMNIDDIKEKFPQYNCYHLKYSSQYDFWIVEPIYPDGTVADEHAVFRCDADHKKSPEIDKTFYSCGYHVSRKGASFGATTIGEGVDKYFDFVEPNNYKIYRYKDSDVDRYICEADYVGARSYKDLFEVTDISGSEIISAISIPLVYGEELPDISAERQTDEDKWKMYAPGMNIDDIADRYSSYNCYPMWFTPKYRFYVVDPLYSDGSTADYHAVFRIDSSHSNSPEVDKDFYSDGFDVSRKGCVFFGNTKIGESVAKFRQSEEPDRMKLYQLENTDVEMYICEADFYGARAYKVIMIVSDINGAEILEAAVIHIGMGDELKEESPFPDVSVDDWYYEAVVYNSERGFITGYKNGNFGPADTLKRQDFVVILARIANADLSTYTSCALKDVDMNAYYGPSVAWAVDKGIITGYANGKFGVGDSITREQVATILYRYMGKPTITATVRNSVLMPFNDKGKISAFAVDAMAWAVKNGVISGKNSTTLAPTMTASRAEIATIVMRMDTKGMFD